MRCRWWWILSAAALLFSWDRVEAEPGEVVAEIGGEKITRADLERFRSSVQRALSQEAPAQSDSALLRSLVDKKALLMDGRRSRESARRPGSGERLSASARTSWS